VQHGHPSVRTEHTDAVSRIEQGAAAGPPGLEGREEAEGVDGGGVFADERAGTGRENAVPGSGGFDVGESGSGIPPPGATEV
jgi:hypothetical protein